MTLSPHCVLGWGKADCELNSVMWREAKGSMCCAHVKLEAGKPSSKLLLGQQLQKGGFSVQGYSGKKKKKVGGHVLSEPLGLVSTYGVLSALPDLRGKEAGGCHGSSSTCQTRGAAFWEQKWLSGVWLTSDISHHVAQPCLLTQPSAA